MTPKQQPGVGGNSPAPGRRFDLAENDYGSASMTIIRTFGLLSVNASGSSFLAGFFFVW
jgi:hypothetical protein